MIDFVGIVKKRIVIDGALYNRYFLDLDGRRVGIPMGIYFHAPKHSYPAVYIHYKVAERYGIQALRILYKDELSQRDAIRTAIEALRPKLEPRKISFDAPMQDNPIELVNVTMPKGICLVSSRAGTVKSQIQFSVCVFDEKRLKIVTKILYCGTPSTWRRNFASAYRKAVELREKSLRAYYELNPL